MLHDGASRPNYLWPSCTLMARGQPPIAFVNELLHFLIRHWEPVGKLVADRKISPNQQQRDVATWKRGWAFKWRNQALKSLEHHFSWSCSWLPCSCIIAPCAAPFVANCTLCVPWAPLVAWSETPLLVFKALSVAVGLLPGWGARYSSAAGGELATGNLASLGNCSREVETPISALSLPPASPRGKNRGGEKEDMRILMMFFFFF